MRKLLKLIYILYSFIAYIGSGRSNLSLDKVTSIENISGTLVDYLLGHTNKHSVKEFKIKAKAYYNLDVSYLPEDTIKQVKDYIKYIKQKYSPDENLKK